MKVVSLQKCVFCWRSRPPAASDLAVRDVMRKSGICRNLRCFQPAALRSCSCKFWHFKSCIFAQFIQIVFPASMGDLSVKLPICFWVKLHCLNFFLVSEVCLRWYFTALISQNAFCLQWWWSARVASIQSGPHLFENCLVTTKQHLFLICSCQSSSIWNHGGTDQKNPLSYPVEAI